MDENPSTEIEQLDWVAVPADLRGGVERAPGKRKIRHWLLVLQSQQMPCRIEQHHGVSRLMVPSEHFLEALAELRHYEQTNNNWPPSPPITATSGSSGQPIFWVFLALAVFHFLTQREIGLCGTEACNWILRGNAHAEQILAGQWWRTITALTLHSNTLHLFGNTVIGGLVMVRLGQMFGSGTAFFLVLCSGAGGNLLNALLQSPDHRSIGASTAVFGAIGLLAVVNTLRYRHSLWRRWPVPIAAALGLLAMLGTGGDGDILKTDIGAHLLGFACGMAIGCGSLLFKNGFATTERLNVLFGTISLALVLTAWWIS